MRFRFATENAFMVVGGGGEITFHDPKAGSQSYCIAMWVKQLQGELKRMVCEGGGGGIPPHRMEN